MLYTRGYQRSHKRSGRALFKALGGAKTTNQRYRLYADGAIYDNELKREVAYITDNLDEIYRMRGKTLQKYLKDYMKQ